MTWQAPLLLGALAGTGLFTTITALVPRRPDLGAALAHLDDTTPPNVPTSATTIYERVGLHARRRLGQRIPGQILSPTDIALLNKEPHLLLGEKIVTAMVMLAAPTALTAALITNGVHLPLVLPAAFSIALAAVGWFIPDLIARSQAEELRTEFSQAASIYLDLISIARISGAMPHEALNSAATVADTWPFKRIAKALTSSQWDGQPPWDALDQLSTDVNVPALADVADIMRLSGETGASVYESLRGRARSLRNTQLSEEHARENAATERLTIPATVPTIIVLLMVVYPSLLKLLS